MHLTGAGLVGRPGKAGATGLAHGWCGLGGGAAAPSTGTAPRSAAAWTRASRGMDSCSSSQVSSSGW